MQVRKVEVSNFRGIRSLNWMPSSRLTCLIGPGDSGKSTILDAIEAALSPRWQPFTDADFTNCDANSQIDIRVTIGELPSEALRENRMGMHLRGWGADGLHDEPEGDDEPVLTVRLTVDNTLEPAWELITDRGDPRPISNRDRALFCVVRLSADVDRHLTFANGSALARLSANGRESASPVLAEAYRRARALVDASNLDILVGAAREAHQAGSELGAYAAHEYSPGLDAQRVSLGLGTLALHSASVPVRLAGLGTRRLVSLALQRRAIPEGAVVLVDEIEHGLEPHRLRHALRHLHDSLSPSDQQTAFGQVLLTTHSQVAVVELSAEHLAVVRRDDQANQAVHNVSSSLQAMVRRVPEAMLARRLVVCEGKTEVGILRAMRELWSEHHGGVPIEHRGVAIVDGGGTEAPTTAIELARLGFEVCLLVDSDVPVPEGARRSLGTLGVPIIEWGDDLATEQCVLRDVGDDAVQQLLDIAIAHVGIDSVRALVHNALHVSKGVTEEFSAWDVPGKTRPELRQGFASAAKTKSWFKRIDFGEEVGRVIATEARRGLAAPLTERVEQVERWAYGG